MPIAENPFRIFSSLRDDVYHADSQTHAYEWWYFDAVSRDGRDVLVIIFLTNFIFSPRYHQIKNDDYQIKRGRENPLPSPPLPPRFPAIAVCLYRDGRPVIRSFNEYAALDFAASREHPACRIGASDFALTQVDGKWIYQIRLDVALRKGKRLQAALSWAVCEADLTSNISLDSNHKNDASSSVSGAQEFDDAQKSDDAHEWNFVAPRCAVTGEFQITAKDSSNSNFSWHGTGYHDHNRDTRRLTAKVKTWLWGRAHFADLTAIFYHFQPSQTDPKQINEKPVEAAQTATNLSRLIIVKRGGQLFDYHARITQTHKRRNRFGLSYARDLSLTPLLDAVHNKSGGTQPQVFPKLIVNQQQVIDASFFYLRFRGEATLEIGNHTFQAPLVSEYLAPRALNFRWLDWLINMRIARNGKTAFLP